MAVENFRVEVDGVVHVECSGVPGADVEAPVGSLALDCSAGALYKKVLHGWMCLGPHSAHAFKSLDVSAESEGPPPIELLELADDEAPEGVTHDDLEQMTKSELKDLAKELGLSKSGSVTDLFNRIGVHLGLLEE